MTDETIAHVRVKQMTNDRGRAIANQFTINTPAGEYFQSYATIIAFKMQAAVGSYSHRIFLDRKCWDYSTTTGKYRNQFLGEHIAETRKKIKAGEYTLADLNGPDYNA